MTILEIMSLVIQQTLAQCNKQNHFMNVLCDMLNVFKISNKDVKVTSVDVILMSVLIQFSPFHKLQGLLHCINEISQKKDAVENVDQQTKVPFHVYVW